MQIDQLLSNLKLDGSLQCTSPHGNLSIEASKASNRMDINFENGKTFRYFLDSMPASGGGGGGMNFDKLRAVPQSVFIKIDNSPLLTKKGNKVNVNYLRGAKHWLRWKLGL